MQPESSEEYTPDLVKAMPSPLSTALQVATEAAAAVIAPRSHARATGDFFAHAALQLSPPSARK